MLATVLLGPAAVHAQTARTGGSANAQLLEQMQQLASERTSLQAENAKMKKELDDLRKERDALKKGQQAAAAVDQRAKVAAAALAQANSQRATATQELEQTKAKTQELIAKFRETIQTLKPVESEDAIAKQTVATREQELKACVDHNLALYKLNAEILTHFDHESAWTRVARTEPFTQIKRAQLENLVDDYKARAGDQRVKPGEAVSQPPGPPSQATSAPKSDSDPPR